MHEITSGGVSGISRSSGQKKYAPRFSRIHGYRRSYIRAGRGPAVLLIHGIGDSSQTWGDLIPLLARNHTVIAPDLLGHGLSDKPRADYSIAGYACGMRDLLGVLDIDEVSVVGHSLGAGVAMQFAYQFPERCERLALVAPGGVGRGVSALLRAGTLPASELVLPLLTTPVSRTVGRLGLRLMKWANTDLGRDADDLYKMFDALASRDLRRAFLRTLRTSVDWRGQTITMLDRCYLSAAMPTLLVGGGHDAVIPADHVRIAHAAMPGSRMEIFAEAGHFPHRSDPERFLEVLEDFLTTTKPASYSQAQWRELLRSGPAAARAAVGSVPKARKRSDGVHAASGAGTVGGAGGGNRPAGSPLAPVPDFQPGPGTVRGHITSSGS